MGYITLYEKRNGHVGLYHSRTHNCDTVLFFVAAYRVYFEVYRASMSGTRILGGQCASSATNRPCICLFIFTAAHRRRCCALYYTPCFLVWRSSFHSLQLPMSTFSNRYHTRQSSEIWHLSTTGPASRLHTTQWKWHLESGGSTGRVGWCPEMWRCLADMCAHCAECRLPLQMFLCLGM